MTKISKHRKHRANIKRKAVEMKGGRCQRCGHADLCSLQFVHVPPLLRGRNGLSRKAACSTSTHRAVIRGEGKRVRLLCCNCASVIHARVWKASSVNTKRAQAVT